MIDEPVMHVDYVCPRCRMTLKPPVRREGTLTWVQGRTRYYAHARCYPEVTGDGEGVDNGGMMETQQTATTTNTDT